MGGVLEIPAYWQPYRMGAGSIRNQQMLDEGRATDGLAFHPDLDVKSETGDTIRRLRETEIAFAALWDKMELATEGRGLLQSKCRKDMVLYIGASLVDGDDALLHVFTNCFAKRSFAFVCFD